MNVVLNPSDFNSSYLYFTEPKANTHIPNSTFNRIAYSTPEFIMTGVYFNFELNIHQIEKNFNNVYMFYFDINHELNKTVISILDSIEDIILQKWKKLHMSTPQTTMTSTTTRQVKTPINDIMRQLSEGFINVWKQDVHISEKPVFHKFVIKISGVWENDTEYGLTYKII